ncbi:unnamed protein product, partial [Durusdinium trenchii]
EVTFWMAALDACRRTKTRRGVSSTRRLRCAATSGGTLQELLLPLLKVTPPTICTEDAEELPPKKAKSFVLELRKSLEPLEEAAPEHAAELLRQAAAEGVPQQMLEPFLARLLRVDRAGSESLLLCYQLLELAPARSFGEALLSVLVAQLAQHGRLHHAEGVLRHAVSTGSVKMRTFQPLMDSYVQLGDSQRLQQLFHSVLRPLVLQDQVRLNGHALMTLLQGFASRPRLQDEVLSLLSQMELELLPDDLERNARSDPPVPRARAAPPPG